MDFSFRVVVRAVFAFVLLLPRVDAAEEEAGEVVLPSTANAWFKPVLVENRSTICSAVLDEANRLFYSQASRIDIVPIAVKELAVVDPQTDLAQEQITEAHPQTGEPMERTQAFLTTHGKKLYVAVRTRPGCGGACETQQMIASTRPFGPPMYGVEDASLSETPAAPVFAMLKSRDDLYHVAVVEDDQLQLFTLTENAVWEGVCKVSMRPNDPYADADGELRATLQSIHELQSTIGDLRQGAGECGTLRAHDRGGQLMGDAFAMARYRPWAFYGRYVRTFRDVPGGGLDEWSAIGIHEYAAVQRFRSQLPLTSSQLALFYTRKFGWSDAESALAAEKAIAAVLGQAFAFSSYDFPNDGSMAVRHAILENKSIAELEALHWNPSPPKADRPLWNESVLSVAVKHPAALRWLLTKKLDPNHANAFGKTPLMYAAQHNALAAVQILLAAGADPSAATIYPEDTCTYTLSRANVTALHYAVRYGSADVVAALIAGGAPTFVKTDQRDGLPELTPLEWLRLYASPNIADVDRPRLEQLLNPAGGNVLVEYAEQQALRAEKQYAAGDMDAARRSLKNALQANPTNARALSDLSLVALRAGQYGESLEAATRLIAESRDPRMTANAWFNVGLACERSGIRYLRYNGEHYCWSSAIFPFFQSWLAANSRARAEKLEQLLSAPGTQRCVVSQPGSADHRYVFVRGADRGDGTHRDIQRIYVLHPAGSTVSPTQIHWNVTPYVGRNPVSRPVTPSLVGSHRLGASAITVLESEDEVQPPVMIGGHKCF